MENHVYTLQDVMNYKVSANIDFTEIFILYVVKAVASQLLCTYHLASRVHGQVRPSNIKFTHGELKLVEASILMNSQQQRNSDGDRNYKTLIERFYIPPDSTVSTKYDIFSLGQISLYMTGASVQYSGPLLALMESMLQQEPTERPCSQEIVFRCHQMISREASLQINQFDSEYSSLTKNYIQAYDHMLLSYRRAWAEVQEKKERLVAMENKFFYKTQEKKSVKK